MVSIDLLIKNAVIITMNDKREIIENGAMAVKADRIIDIGRSDAICEKYHADKIIDCAGNVAMPGLINCHSHAGHSIIGKLDSNTMSNWWKALIDVYENYSDNYFWYTDARLNACQVIRNGITTSVNVMGSTPMGDHQEIPQSHAKGYAEVGAREILGVGIPHDDSYPKNYTRWIDGVHTKVSASYDDMLAGTEETLKTVHNAHDGLTKVFVTPHQQLMGHSPGVHNPSQLTSLTPMERDINAKVRALARKYKTQVYTDTYGGWVTLAYTDKENMLLGPDVLIGMEHVAATNYREAAIIAETGTKVYYTSEGYYKRVPISEMMAMGVPVAITTNGCAPRTILDLLESLRRLIMAERIFHDDSNYIPSGKALEAITIDAAKCIGMEDELGSLEIGKKADISILDWHKPHLSPMIFPVHRVVYNASGGDFITVIVNGKVIMEDGKFITVNEQQILCEAAELHERVVRNCNLHHTVSEVIWGKTRNEYI